jgi:hypothetical protein
MLMDRRSSLGSFGCVMSAVALFGCAAAGGETDAVSKEAALEAAPELMVQPFEDPEGIAAVGDGEVRRSIRSDAQYERVFGHAPPDGVDLSGRTVAIFYTPGVQRTGGYEASFEKVEVRRRTLVVTTRLTSPGPNCAVTDALTHPYALASVRVPRGVSRVRFETDDVVRDCEVPPTCEGKECAEGEHCELTPVVCITAPCPAIPECVADEITCGGFTGKPCPGDLTCVDDPDDDCDPKNGGADCGGICVPQPGPFCGGIAGFACPGAGQCVDDPTDSCDPEMGGADCGGNCVCVAIALCIQGSHFDTDPKVCACVPDTQPDPCAAVRCAAGTHCEVVGEDAAACVPNGPECGGFAGIACAGLGRCVDDPSDACDPEMGGADCGGNCVCDALAKCREGSHFDADPKVCTCVPDTTLDPCAAVRCAAGTHCEVIGEDAAACVSDGPFCGGIAGIPCPGAGQCTDDPNDGCDPMNGGADCGGRCECNALGLCEAGYLWDSSPDVCGCVLEHPCIATLCGPGTTCEEIDGAAYCLSDGTQACGQATCGKGTSCCNPLRNICTEPGMFCIF